MKKERNEPLFYDTNEKGVQQYREDVEKEKEENMVFVENVKELAMLRNRIMEKYNDVLNTYNSFKFNLLFVIISYFLFLVCYDSRLINLIVDIDTLQAAALAVVADYDVQRIYLIRLHSLPRWEVGSKHSIER